MQYLSMFRLEGDELKRRCASLECTTSGVPLRRVSSWVYFTCASYHPTSCSDLLSPLFICSKSSAQCYLFSRLSRFSLVSRVIGDRCAVGSESVCNGLRHGLREERGALPPPTGKGTATSFRQVSSASAHRSAYRLNIYLFDLPVPLIYAPKCFHTCT